MGQLIKGLVVIAVVWYAVHYFYFRERSEREIALDTAIRMINEQKGKMIDSVTMLKGAYSSSGGMVITYQITEYNDFSQRQNYQQYIEQVIGPRLCRDRHVKDMLALDVVVSLHYLSPRRKKLAQVSLNKDRCH